MKHLRVLVLMNAESAPPESTAGLSKAEIYPFKMEYEVLSALKGLNHEVLPLGLEDELAPIRTAIREFRPHVVFNLIMHFHGVGIYDAHVVSYLELLRKAYTGCNPQGILLASNKALSKKIMAWHRIPTPGFTVFPRGRAVRERRKLSFPLFVKSTVEHASTGISQASIVHDLRGLRQRVAFVHDRVGTDAIGEQYIEGREFTVSVLGNQRLTAFEPWELLWENLPAGSEPIATSAAKWNLAYQDRIGLTTGPAVELPQEKEAEMIRIAKRVFRALDMSGFARVDLRMAQDGRLFVLEANPNPDLCQHEDFARAAEHAGISYPELIQRILNLGMRYTPAWKEDET